MHAWKHYRLPLAQPRLSPFNLKSVEEVASGQPKRIHISAYTTLFVAAAYYEGQKSTNGGFEYANTAPESPLFFE